MAYNYFPATYQPYQPVYQQASYQPTYQQPVQQQNGIIWVSGDAEAEAYPIAPNSAVRLWHSNLPVVYFKAADASGKPTLKAYDLVERIQKPSGGVSAATDIGATYATKSELEAVSAALAALKKEVREGKHDDE